MLYYNAYLGNASQLPTNVVAPIRYVIDGRAFTEFALTNLYDTERATTTAITIGNTTIEIKVPRNMKPGDFLKARKTFFLFV